MHHLMTVSYEKPLHEKHFKVRTRIGLILVALAMVAGCRGNATRFEITNYREDDKTEYFHELFDECYYSIAPNGNVDLVARRHISDFGAPGEPAEDLTQIVHVHTVFRAIPGTTHVERTMINGVVNYAILGDHGGACFEGAGFLSCKENRGKTVLTGKLELAKLHPNRRVGFAADIFNHAELTGAFSAKRNRKKVVSLLNELNRFFGPQPQYQPSPNQSDPM